MDGWMDGRRAHILRYDDRRLSDQPAGRPAGRPSAAELAILLGFSRPEATNRPTS